MKRTLTASSSLALLPLLAVVGAGCHLVLDPDQYRLDYDGGPDAPPPDAAPPDVNPALLAIDSVEPNEAFEGQGAFAGGPGVTVILHGSSIAPGATVTLDGVPGATLDHVTIAADGSAIGAVLRLPVDTASGAGAADQTLTLTVSQSEPAVTAMATITVHPLDELVLSGALTNAATLKPLYSTITTSASARLSGLAKARLLATSSIVVSQALDASGGVTTDVGAGGCAGGGTGANGGCGNSGGAAGAGAQTLAIGSGGGGGGAAMSGGVGGQSGGDGGMPSGNGYLVPFVGGNGGGGGGTGGVLLGIPGGKGGVGGAGGGAIELTSQGSLQITAALSADGGDGAMTNSGGCSQGGGGGGGGSGGSLLLRADGELVVSAALSAQGGAAGPEAASGCGNGGGGGAPGFIRLDAPAATLGTLDAMPAVVRGPMWKPDSAQVVSTPTVTLTLFGTPNHSYGYSVGAAAVQAARPLSTGAVDVDITLAPRVLTPVCAYVSNDLSGDSLNLPEARNCRVLVYIP